MSESDTSLLPCAHCGSTATATQDAPRWWIECDGCGIHTPTDNFGDPVMCWNIRIAPPSEIAELRAAKESAESLVLMYQSEGEDELPEEGQWRKLAHIAPSKRTKEQKQQMRVLAGFIRDNCVADNLRQTVAELRAQLAVTASPSIARLVRSAALESFKYVGEVYLEEGVDVIKKLTTIIKRVFAGSDLYARGVEGEKK